MVYNQIKWSSRIIIDKLHNLYDKKNIIIIYLKKYQKFIKRTVDTKLWTSIRFIQRTLYFILIKLFDIDNEKKNTIINRYSKCLQVYFGASSLPMKIQELSNASFSLHTVFKYQTHKKSPYASLQNKKAKANLSISLLTNMQCMLLIDPIFFFFVGGMSREPSHIIQTMQ